MRDIGEAAERDSSASARSAPAESIGGRPSTNTIGTSICMLSDSAQRPRPVTSPGAKAMSADRDDFAASA